MTKRFTVKDDVGMLDVACGNIFDNGEFVGTVPLFDIGSVVDLLNELYDENEQLKSEKEHYKKQVDELDGLLNKYEITFEELEEILDNDYRERF